MPKISVIVPVFNAEKYLVECARSLFEQTLDDIEYIFINDGSTDDSIMVLQSVLSEYPNRTAATKIINFDKNSGLQDVIKTGILESSGDYIIRCDSDDWVRRDAYELMYNEAVSSDSDIVECGYCYVYGKEITSGDTSSYGRDVIFDIMVGSHPAFLCTKLFKSTLKEGLHYFAVANMWDDIPITIQLYCNSRHNSFMSVPLYFYRQRVDSICNSVSDESIVKKWHGAVDNAKVVIQYFEEMNKYKEYKEALVVLKLRSLFYAYPVLRFSNNRAVFRNTYPGLFREVLFSRSIKLKQKLGFCLRYFGVIK